MFRPNGKSGKMNLATHSLMIVLGLLTRVASFAVAMDMLGAILLFHRLHGFFVPMGIEFPMMLSASGLALAALGAGSFSIDHALARRRGGV